MTSYFHAVVRRFPLSDQLLAELFPFIICHLSTPRRRHLYSKRPRIAGCGHIFSSTSLRKNVPLGRSTVRLRLLCSKSTSSSLTLSLQRMYQLLKMPILVSLPRPFDVHPTFTNFPKPCLSETRVMTFDAHSWFNNVLDNPRSFGFTNTTGYVATIIHLPLVKNFCAVSAGIAMRTFYPVSTFGPD